jgi:H+-transporting ATPase
MTQSATPTHSTSSQSSNNLADLPLAELMERVHTSPNGLGQEDAKQRLSQFGYNAIAEKKVSPLMKFLSYFWLSRTCGDKRLNE